MHEGTLTVSTKAGSGSTFTVSIPARVAAAADFVQRRTESAEEAARPYVTEAMLWLPGGASGPVAESNQTFARRGATQRILLADDNADMREYVARLLGDRWTVEAVADGATAFDAARARPPALVISDVMMPRLDGFQLLRALRADPITQDTPVMLLSARAGEEASIEALEAGADDYIVKPFSARELRARVEAQLLRAEVRAIAAAHDRRLREVAEEANRAKDHFLAVLGHELRNPLAPIITAAQLLELKGPDDPALRRLRETISRQAHLLLKLVEDLLDVGRIITGKLRLEKTRVDVGAIVKQAIESVSPSIQQRHHTLKVDLPSDPVYVEADAARMCQVICNLLTNAAKFTPAPGVIELSAFDDSARVFIRVRDHGIGIAPDMLDRVFDRFVQASDSNTMSSDGLGIGLSVVKTIVDLHGGSVVARSDGPGMGSEFTVSLPVLAPAMSPVIAIQ